MQQKIITKGIVLIVATLCVFIAWKFCVVEIPTLYVNNKALEQLQADLKNVSPHFIDASKGGAQILTPEEQKIKEDVVALFIAEQPDNSDYYSQLRLNAVGERHVLISQLSVRGSYDEILDSQTGKVTPISAEVAYYHASEGRNIALYLGTQAIYIYALDKDGVVLVSGSQLLGNETYHSGTSDFSMVPVQTHAKNSITISIFDSSQLVQNPDAQPNAMQTMNKKMRQTTLLLP